MKMMFSANQMVVLPRLGDGAISQLGMRELISKYEEYKKKTPEGSALSMKVLVKEKLLELICDTSVGSASKRCC